ncbi:hypothetical protein [Dickeya chrysanthemi]|nr:hypothetical protein [Dickeya chrysanthemi]
MQTAGRQRASQPTLGKVPPIGKRGTERLAHLVGQLFEFRQRHTP